MSEKEQELHNSYLWHNKPMEYGEWCYLKGKEDAIDEFADMMKQFVKENGTIPNHFNIDKIAELLKQK